MCCNPVCMCCNPVCTCVRISPPSPSSPLLSFPPILLSPSYPSVAAGVIAINDIIDADDTDALLDALQNEFVLLTNVKEEHRVPLHYFTMLKALKSSKAEVRQDTPKGDLILSRQVAECVTTACRMFRPHRPFVSAIRTVLYAADNGLRMRPKRPTIKL